MINHPPLPRIPPRDIPLLQDWAGQTSAAVAPCPSMVTAAPSPRSFLLFRTTPQPPPGHQPASSGMSLSYATSPCSGKVGRASECPHNPTCLGGIETRSCRGPMSTSRKETTIQLPPVPDSPHVTSPVVSGEWGEHAEAAVAPRPGIRCPAVSFMPRQDLPHPRWISLSEHGWVIFRERNSQAATTQPPPDHHPASSGPSSSLLLPDSLYSKSPLPGIGEASVWIIIDVAKRVWSRSEVVPSSVSSGRSRSCTV